MTNDAWPPRPEGHTPDKTGRPDEPWLTREAITYLSDTVRRHDKILEYGAGASTVWFSKRAFVVDSIEHDRAWFDLVGRAVGTEILPNVGLHHVPATNDFEEYVQFGRKLGAQRGGYDVVVVDGRRRVRCVKAIAEFVVPGGILVLDNAERPQYSEGHEFLSKWFAKRTTNGIWRTDIFRKG
jgi:predicted O-methyltransferase YrrM